MSEAEFSASEDGMFVAESSNQSSPSKPIRGTSKRGRGRPKRTRKISSDNDSSSNGLHVSSLKHVGKFRYLSNLTQAESAEADPAKPVASRGKRGNGRSRGRGRSSSNHMTSSANNTGEPSSHVSRSGRRIKPNNRWAPDADFDPGPGKVLPGRVSTRKTAAKNAKVIPEEKPSSNIKTEIDSNCKQELSAEEESTQQLISNTEDRLEAGNDCAQETSVKEEVLSSTSLSAPETIELDHQFLDDQKDSAPTVEIETTIISTETSEVSKDALPFVIEEQDLILEVHDTVVVESSITVETISTCEAIDECIPNEVNENGCQIEDDSVPTESSPVDAVNLQLTSHATENCNNEAVSECQKDIVNHIDASDSTGSERDDSSQGVCVKDGTAEQLYNSSAGNTPRRDDEAFDSQSVLISPKPVKVKSRWRRTSELEQVVVRNGNSDQSSCNNSPLSMSPKTSFGLPSSSDRKEELLEEKNQAALSENIAIIEERLKSFEIVEENRYLTSRKTSKEVKRMLCDCTLSKEEIARGELGCGEDCINRLLMIECGPRCQLASRCTNKRFQKRQYGKIEVFNTEKKGVGLRALQDMEPGDFIIEYVGEVIDPREFHRRAKDYAREKNKHYYFMALKSDAIIDATQQGNVSRFINHSCDPNAETQKWTVNGDLRVGFFARKSLKTGDEVTFDYQFQRYGKEAQRCYCESSNCRGWIGEDPEKEDKNRDKKEKKRKIRVFRDEVNNIDLESEIERLMASGVKNRAQTLNLSRLMVRAEDFEARRNILTVLRNSEQACRRLFLDYHGLKLLWGWMVDASSLGQSSDNVQFKIDLLSTLSSLPVPNKTMLLDSKLITIVEKWTVGVCEPQLTVETIKTEESSENVEPIENQAELGNQVIAMASQLLDSWSNLKEVFRIPKKERIEKMKEHEREADQECEDPIPDTDEPVSKQSSYDRRPNNHHRVDMGYRDVKDREKSKRLRESPDRENRKIPRLETDNISKEERRRLFALKVAQQDEELRVRRCQEDVWRRHLEQCLSFGVEPTMTPLNLEATPFIASASPGMSVGLAQSTWDPLLGVWQPCLDELGSTSANLSALTPLSESSSTTLAKPISYEPPILHLVIPKGYNPTVMGPLIMDFDLCKHEASGIPYVPASLVVPLLNEVLVDDSPVADSREPSQSSKLPRFWRQAIDTRGRTYYYHVRLRLPQWEPPTPEGDTPDFSSEEEEEEEEAEEEAVPITTSHITEPVASPIIENPKEQERERRRSLLCHERIISPRSEFERSDDAQRYRELKERVLRQKLARIRERGLWIEETKTEDKTKSRDKERRKLNEKEKEKMRKRAKEKYKRSLLKGENRKKIKELNTKDISETIQQAVEKDAETSINGEGNDISMERDLMDGSLDDYMLMNLGEGEDEAGEQERNRDVSANTVRKIKDAFRMKISSDIVNILNPYRRPDCKLGRITCTDDFKHLARKMTHFVLAKELKHCRNIEDLVVNDSVKHKAKDFIKKYMVKFGPAYKRGNDDDA